MKIAIFNDTRFDNLHYGCYSVMSNLIFHLKNNGLRPSFFWPVGRDWRRERQYLPAKDDVDAIIVNGEGSIHHSRERANCLAETSLLAKNYYGVPCFLINATLYKNNDILYDKCRHFDGIFVRDKASLDELQAFGLDAMVVPDLTLSVSRPPSPATRRGIGATDSVIRDTDQYIVRLCKRRGYEYIPMAKNTTRKFRFKDFLKPGGMLRQWHSDFTRSGVPELPRPKDVEEFLRWLEGKALVLTGRYHTVAMCLLTRTPFVCFESNTPKISFLLNDVFGNTHRRLQKKSDLDSPRCLGYSSFSEKEIEQIDTFLASATDRNHQMFKDIARIVRAQGKTYPATAEAEKFLWS